MAISDKLKKIIKKYANILPPPPEEIQDVSIPKSTPFSMEQVKELEHLGSISVKIKDYTNLTRQRKIIKKQLTYSQDPVASRKSLVSVLEGLLYLTDELISIYNDSKESLVSSFDERALPLEERLSLSKSEMVDYFISSIKSSKQIFQEELSNELSILRKPEQQEMETVRPIR